MNYSSQKEEQKENEAPIPRFNLQGPLYHGPWKAYIPQNMQGDELLSPLKNLHRVAPYIDTSPGLSRSYSTNQSYSANNSHSAK